LYYSGALNAFAFEYADRNRDKLLNQFKAASFVEGYVISAEVVTELKKYLLQKQLLERLSGQETGLKDLLKALIGRNLFDKDAYYPILNQHDDAVVKAIEVLDKQSK
jgi:adenosine deaminase